MKNNEHRYLFLTGLDLVVFFFTPVLTQQCFLWVLAQIRLGIQEWSHTILIQCGKSFHPIWLKYSQNDFIANTKRFHYTELLKRTDTCTHVRAKFSRIGAKFKFLNAEIAKQSLFKFLYNFTKLYLCIYIVYIFILYWSQRKALRFQQLL